MKKIATIKRPRQFARKYDYAQLVSAISSINTQMVGRVATVANQALVLRNWIIGAYIVEFEQNGADRAQYGARLLATLAVDLKALGLKGLDARTLLDCRVAYGIYPQIRGTVSPELAIKGAATAIPGALSPGDNPPIGILLCSDKDGTEVEYATAGMDQKLFVARYLTTLPSADQLKAFLERDRAEITTLTTLRAPSRPSR